MNVAARLLLVSAAAVALPLAASTGDETHSGCVMQTEAGWFTFCEPDACSVIKGVGVDAKLSGHKVTVSGTVQLATAQSARTFVVTKVIAIGDKCDEICSPTPSKHRGIGGKDMPGSEAGTPGVVAPPAVPPPHE